MMPRPLSKRRSRDSPPRESETDPSLCDSVLWDKRHRASGERVDCLKPTADSGKQLIMGRKIKLVRYLTHILYKGEIQCGSKIIKLMEDTGSVKEDL